MTVSPQFIGLEAFQNLPMTNPGEMWVWYTGKDQAGNNASATLLKGHIVALKSVPTPLVGVYPLDTTTVVCEAETAYLGVRKFAVLDVPDGCGVAGTGGFVLVRAQEGPVQLLVATGATAGAKVFMANGALKATVTDPGIGSRDVVGALCGCLMEANASGADALAWANWNPAVS